MTIAEVTQLYVEAPDRAAAAAQVEQALLRQLAVSAQPASPQVSRLYAEGSRRDRAALLMQLDGLAPPRTEGLPEKRRRLERLIAQEEEWRKAVEGEVASAPPVSQQAAEALAEVVSARQARTAWRRLREFDRLVDPRQAGGPQT